MPHFHSRRSKNLPTKKPRKPISKQPAIIPNNSMAGTIGQGVGIGAGAAMGNMAVNGLANAVSGSSETNNKQTQTTFTCNHILESFQNCMYSQNDTVLCKPQLELFNKCVEDNKLN